MLTTYAAKLLPKIVMSAILAISLAASARAQQSPYDGAERQRWALETLKAVAPIYKALPTLFPAEDQWVQSELKASVGAGSQRAEHLLQSREWAIYTARISIDESYACLAELTGRPLPVKRRQALLWAIVVYDLNRDDLYEALDRLADMGGLDPKFVRGPEAKVGMLKGVWAYYAMTSIVIPFLDNRLPD